MIVTKNKKMRTFIVALIVLVSITSCKKSSSGSPTNNNTNNTNSSVNTITATVSGVTEVHGSANGSYGVSSNTGNYIMEVASLSGTTTIQVHVSSPTPIANGTTFTNTVASQPVDFYYGAFATFFSPGTPDGIVTITTISATGVTGTFSGDVYDINGVKQTFTSGSFNVTF
jgi:hypothetical protein